MTSTSLGETPSAGPPLIHSSQSPDLFADEVSGISVVNGTVRLTLATFRVDHNAGQGARVVTARLVMPVVGAENMLRLLADTLVRAKQGEAAAAGFAVAP